MDDFRMKLGGQVNRFVEQAKEVDGLDRRLVVERDRALKLQLNSAGLKKRTDALSTELELILHHQDEMHAALSELERKVEAEGRAFPDRPGERQQAYALAEELDKQIADTRALLTNSISKLNERNGTANGAVDGVPPPSAASNGGGDSQLNRIVHVLDVHLNAFQYLETNATKLDSALAQADKLLVQPQQRARADEHFGLY